MASRPDYVGPTVLLTLIQVVISWAVFAPPVLARQALPEMGIDPSWIGLQTTTVFVAAMISSNLSGSLVSRINPMRVNQVLVLFAAGGIALIATGTLPAAIAGSILVGMGLGPGTPASSHVLAQVTPRQLQPLIFSIKQTGVPVGGALAGFVGPPLMVLWDWQSALLVVSAAGVAVVCMTEFWVRGYARFADPASARKVELIAPLRILVSNLPLRWMMMGVLPMLAAQYALTTFIVLYLQDEIGLSVVTAGAILAIAQASGGVGRIVFGAVATRLLSPLSTLLMLSAFASLAAFLTAAMTASWPLALVYGLGVLFGASAVGWNGVYISEVARQAPPGEVGRATGAVGFVIFGGVVTGPLVFSTIVAVSDFHVAYACIGALTLTSLFSFLRSRRAAARLSA